MSEPWIEPKDRAFVVTVLSVVAFFVVGNLVLMSWTWHEVATLPLWHASALLTLGVVCAVGAALSGESGKLATFVLAFTSVCFVAVCYANIVFYFFPRDVRGTWQGKLQSDDARFDGAYVAFQFAGDNTFKMKIYRSDPNGADTVNAAGVWLEHDSTLQIEYKEGVSGTRRFERHGKFLSREVDNEQEHTKLWLKTIGR